MSTYDPDAVRKMQEEIEAKQTSGSSSPEDVASLVADNHLRLQAERGHTPAQEALQELPDINWIGPQQMDQQASKDVMDKGWRILEKLEFGEPFFIFRAKDFFSVMVLAHYVEVVEKYGPDNASFHTDIIDALGEFKEWQRNNAAKVRYPD